VCLLWCIPLSLRLLGPERYGLWLTVGSLLAWFGMSDLGMTRGLVNALADAFGRDDTAEMRRQISTGFFTFAALACLLLLVVEPVSSWSRLPRLLGVAPGSGLAADARLLVIVCGVIFAGSFSLRAIGSICLALQEGYLKFYTEILATLGGLGALAVLTWQGGSLVAFALVMGLPPLFGNGLLGAYLFGRRHRDLSPKWRLWNRGSFRTIMSFGGPLLVVQIATLAILYSTNLLIANRLGPAQVTRYAVPYAMFMTVAGMCSVIVSPYLPAYAEAAQRGDWTWIRRRAFRSLGITVALMALADLGFAAAGREVIRVWAGENVVPELGFLLAMAVFFVVRVWTDTNGVLLIGLGLVKAKAVLYTTVAALYVGGCWFLLPRFGIVAVPIVGTAAFLIDGVWSLPYALRHIRRRVMGPAGPPGSCELMAD